VTAPINRQVARPSSGKPDIRWRSSNRGAACAARRPTDDCPILEVLEDHDDIRH